MSWAATPALGGLSLPSDFPGSDWLLLLNTVNAHEEKHRPGPWSEARREWGGAWNAVVYRFINCAEDDEAFRGELKKLGPTPAVPGRYAQERLLFTFSCAAVSTLESLTYGLYALGAIVSPNNFPLSAPRNTNPRTTLEQFEALFPTEPLTQKLSWINSSEFKKIRDMRAMLFHRLTPGRHISEKVQWGTETIDEALTAEKREWVAEVLVGTIPAAVLFASAMLK